MKYSLTWYQEAQGDEPALIMFIRNDLEWEQVKRLLDALYELDVTEITISREDKS
jgi:hypothetical protein